MRSCARTFARALVHPHQNASSTRATEHSTRQQSQQQHNNILAALRAGEGLGRSHSTPYCQHARYAKRARKRMNVRQLPHAAKTRFRASFGWQVPRLQPLQSQSAQIRGMACGAQPEPQAPTFPAGQFTAPRASAAPCCPGRRGSRPDSRVCTRARHPWPGCRSRTTACSLRRSGPHQIHCPPQRTRRHCRKSGCRSAARPSRRTGRARCERLPSQAASAKQRPWRRAAAKRGLPSSLAGLPNDRLVLPK